MLGRRTGRSLRPPQERIGCSPWVQVLLGITVLVFTFVVGIICWIPVQTVFFYR